MTQKTRHHWKIFSVTLTALLFSCGHAMNTQIPAWNGKLYAGDSKNQGLSRPQEHEFIPASDPKFDAMIAMTDEDFKSFYRTYVLGCRDWKPGIPMIKAGVLFNRHKEQLQRLVQGGEHGK